MSMPAANWLDELAAEGENATRLVSDLEYFARFLQIRPKVGPPRPLVLNAAQKRLHSLLEEQRARTGRVRACVLKARQMGVSTYVAARFFHKTINSPGLRTLILGHEKPASRNLFQIVKRFHEHLPVDLKPSISVSNAEELLFNQLDAGYIVACAGEEGAARSATIQMHHASEVAFWKDLSETFASAMQTIPDLPGTEVILESTANGYNDFYKLWRKAESGESEFLPIFLPWSIDPGYRVATEPDFELRGDERRLAELFGLDNQQIAWRRLKMGQMPVQEKFYQEYPLTASEAFITSNFDSFIDAELVLRARKERIDPYGELILGVDPAGMGADATAIAWRKGHCITKIEKRRGLDTMQVAGWVARIIRDEKPARVNIDVGGLGIGVYDRLREQGHDNVVRQVNFGGKPVELPPLDEAGNPSGGPANRRAELWSNMKKCLEGRLDIPDSESLQADLISVGYKYQSNGQLLLESKPDMRKRGVPSPDEADAMALCFSEPDGSPIVRRSKFYGKIEYPEKGIV